MQSPSESVDVCVVGGGPSGLLVAHLLAAKGIPSLVLEKKTFPSAKACGDNLSGAALKLVSKLFPDFKTELEGRISPVLGVVAYAPNLRRFELDYRPFAESGEPSCYSITRQNLDAYLYEKARSNPLIRLKENSGVLEAQSQSGRMRLRLQNKSIVDAKLVIFCTGSNSSLGRDMVEVSFKSQEHGLGLRAYFTGVEQREPQGFSSLFLTERLFPGGLYVSYLPQGLTNVNLVVRSDYVKRKKINLQQEMNRLLAEHPLLSECFAKAEPTGKPLLSSLSLSSRPKQLSGDNFLLVGDAAGLIDFMSANGLPQAAMSAEIAAETAQLALQSERFDAQFLQAYTFKVHQRTKNYLKTSRFFAPFLNYPIVSRLCLLYLNLLCRLLPQKSQRVIKDLIYDPNLHKTFFKPSFYFALFFGLKNRESL
jgi:flavin-dependent dehydrogenase